MFATITVAGTISAQGPIIANHADGRVTIDEGQRQLTGWPIGRGVRGASAAPTRAARIAVSDLIAAPAQKRTDWPMNVSYGPTRAPFRAYNDLFVTPWDWLDPDVPGIAVSHIGSASPARTLSPA